MSVCVCVIQCYNQGLNFKRNHGFAEPRTTIVAGDRSIFLHNMIHIFVTNWTDGRIIITFREESCYTALTLKSSHFWQFGNASYLKRKNPKSTMIPRWITFFRFSLLLAFILKLSSNHCDISYFCCLVHSSGSNYYIKIGIQILSYLYLSSRFGSFLKKSKHKSCKISMLFCKTKSSEIGVYKINGGELSLSSLTLTHPSLFKKE